MTFHESPDCNMDNFVTFFFLTVPFPEMQKTRHSLNDKIGQLNSAIDNVYSRLRGGKKMPPIPVESEADEFIA